MQLSDSDATEALGARLARHLPAGEEGPLIVYLEGALGAGKTTLARGFLRELGVAGAVRSPSYTLVEQYPVAGRLILHLDLYRLSGEAEYEYLGTRDQFVAGAVWFIEWPERAPRSLPGADLRVSLQAGLSGHVAQLTAGTPAGESWLAATLA